MVGMFSSRSISIDTAMLLRSLSGLGLSFLTTGTGSTLAGIWIEGFLAPRPKVGFLAAKLGLDPKFGFLGAAGLSNLTSIGASIASYLMGSGSATVTLGEGDCTTVVAVGTDCFISFPIEGF